MLLGLDNCSAQKSIEFKKVLREKPCQGFLWEPPPNMTDLAAPQDYELNAFFKAIIKKMFLDDMKENKDVWYDQKRCTTKFVRNKILNFTSVGYRKYCERYPQDITRAFKRCGYYNAMDGSENDEIRIRGYNDAKDESGAWTQAAFDIKAHKSSIGLHPSWGNRGAPKTTTKNKQQNSKTKRRKKSKT